MKEELKEYLKIYAQHEMHYGSDVESWMNLIDEFFMKYQPERLNPKDVSNDVCDSLNTANE